MAAPAPIWRRTLAGLAHATLAGALTLLGMSLDLLPSAALHPEAGWFLVDWWVQLWLDQPRQLIMPVPVHGLTSCAITVLLEKFALGPAAWLSLEVVDEAGLEPSNTQWFRRFLGLFLSVTSLGLGFLWCLISRHHRTWHDLVSGTTILLTKQPRQPS